MPAYLVLDRHLIENRLHWKSEMPDAPAPKMTQGNLGIYCAADLRDLDSTEVVINKRVSVLLDCSIAPAYGFHQYHAHVAVNPRLFDVAEVSAPTIVIPGSDRVRPTLHIRGLRKFDLADFDWVATIHLVD